MDAAAHPKFIESSNFDFDCHRSPTHSFMEIQFVITIIYRAYFSHRIELRLNIY